MSYFQRFFILENVGKRKRKKSVFTSMVWRTERNLVGLTAPHCTKKNKIALSATFAERAKKYFQVDMPCTAACAKRSHA